MYYSSNDFCNFGVGRNTPGNVENFILMCSKITTESAQGDICGNGDQT